MWQKNYAYEDIPQAIEALPELRRELERHPASKDALLQIFVAGYGWQEATELLDSLDREMPGLKRTGCSEYISGDMEHPCGVKLNLLGTEEAEILVVELPCTPGGEEGAASQLKELLDRQEHVRGLELFPVNPALAVTRFMDRVVEGREELPVFGAMANTIGQSLRGEAQEKEVYAIGRKLLSSGFVAVIYAGESLDIYMDYILGWQHVGREFEVTLGERKPVGEGCVKEIDGRPALEVYKKYFGVEWDEFFVANVCEFPLMVQRRGKPICMVPLAKSDAGALYFSAPVYEGEKLCFSYGTEEEVLGSTLAGSERMKAFGPEAVYMSLCGNRLQFLQEEAHLEWDYYRRYFPELVYCHGHFEISLQRGQGGVLNSSFVAVGFREGKAGGGAPAEVHSQPYQHKGDGIIPLSYRMSRFLHMVTHELSEMAVEAEAANRAKSAFLSSMSHEIRTPINAVLGMDEMILRGTEEDDTYGYARDIQTAGRSLLGLVNDILDFSKIEAGKLSIIPVEYSPADVMRDLVNLIQKRAEDKGLSLKVEMDQAMPKVLYGDEVRLKQVITNLLTNGVKYTETGTVTLRAGFRKVQEGQIALEVAVEDTGIGIKAEDLQKLFAPFERIEEKRNRHVEGTGLGMNITRQLLSLMGSRLEVRSVYGEGSAFSFSLLQDVISWAPAGDFRQAAQAPRLEERKAYKARFTAPGARLLVVDDTPMNLTVMKGLLKATKITVDTAGGGRACLEKVREHAYDIIFLDHRMPDMDGQETLAELRREPGRCRPEVPVIAMTANNVIGARDIYLQQGFAEYLLKPVDPELLEELVERFLPAELIEKEGAVSKEDSQPLPKIEGIETKKAAQTMGSPQLYLEVLKEFARAAGENAAALEKFAAGGDIANYTIKVHALKSSARIIGAGSLSEMAAELESLGDEGRLEEIKQKTPALLADYRRLEKALDFLQAPEPAEAAQDKSPLEKGQLAEAMTAVEEFLRVFDYDSAAEVLAMLKEYALPKQVSENVGQLEACIGSFKQEAALELVKEVLSCGEHNG